MRHAEDKGSEPKSLLHLPPRFPGDGVGDLLHHPSGFLFGTTHIQLPLHYGPAHTPTPARHHWSTGSSYGEFIVLCERVTVRCCLLDLLMDQLLYMYSTEYCSIFFHFETIS